MLSLIYTSLFPEKKYITKMANFSAVLTIALLLCSTLMCTARPGPAFSASITIVPADPCNLVSLIPHAMSKFRYIFIINTNMHAQDSCIYIYIYNNHRCFQYMCNRCHNRIPIFLKKIIISELVNVLKDLLHT